MEKANKRRGLITVVVVLSLIAFLGFSLVPILDSILKASQTILDTEAHSPKECGICPI